MSLAEISRMGKIPQDKKTDLEPNANPFFSMYVFNCSEIILCVPNHSSFAHILESVASKDIVAKRNSRAIPLSVVDRLVHRCSSNFLTAPHHTYNRKGAISGSLAGDFLGARG